MPWLHLLAAICLGLFWLSIVASALHRSLRRPPLLPPPSDKCRRNSVESL
jgi:hypothetical protein